MPRISLNLLSWIFFLLVEIVCAEPESDHVSFSKRATAGLAIARNFPDPTVIKVNGTWYAFATHGRGTNIKIQAAQSPDFVTWTIMRNVDGSQYDALPILPTWVDQTNYLTWAPSVHQLDDGTFIMYYSANAAARKGKHCVGAATASNVLGPYTPQPDALACPLSKGGAIDPSAFKDRNGQRYLIYKVDGNSIGRGGPCGNTIPPIVATPLMLQPVSPNGHTFTGPATPLLNNNGTSDQGIIEAPNLIRSRTGTYFLFFSSGCFATPSYTVSYATAPRLFGPYTRKETPLFRTGDGNGLKAPGGMTIWGDDSRMVLHADLARGRAMYSTRILLQGTDVVAI